MEAGSVLIFLIAIGEAAVFVALMYFALIKRKHDLKAGVERLQEQLAEKKKLVEKVNELFNGMVDINELRGKGRELKLVRESLKTERGRITITQAELETVEGRFRELEEVDRELEASGLETKEEINILKKKEKDLAGKNDQLKEQIKISTDQIQDLMSQLKLTVEAAEQIQNMQTELIQSQEKIDTMLLQIEQGNERYFTLKRRYDALDIEYAQLFEKFSEAEAAAGKPQQSGA